MLIILSYDEHSFNVEKLHFFQLCEFSESYNGDRISAEHGTDQKNLRCGRVETVPSRLAHFSQGRQ